MTKKEQMLKEIGIVDFTMVELTLYLDTHPQDKKALEYFKHYGKIKKQMTADFAKEFFPLTKDMADCDKEWSWGMAPLPWEGECR